MWSPPKFNFFPFLMGMIDSPIMRKKNIFLDSLEIYIMSSFWAIYIGYNNRIYGKGYGIKSEVLLGTCRGNTLGIKEHVEDRFRGFMVGTWWEHIENNKNCPTSPKRKKLGLLSAWWFTLMVIKNLYATNYHLWLRLIARPWTIKYNVTWCTLVEMSSLLSPNDLFPNIILI